MPNIEIKARYEDLSRARSIARRLRARFLGIDRQRDTYYRTRQGRLKLRESSQGGARLIPYHRPDRRGPKKSDYALLPVADPAQLKSLLRELLGISIVVDKVREIYLIGNVRVHLDRVKGLGRFFELEAVYESAARESVERRKVARLLVEFGIASRDLLTGSYRELMLKAVAGVRKIDG
jgi:predicted adenylyl cyclase CyaB